jgi:putative transposase
MTQGLERWYGGHDLHFITCSCYHRGPELKSVQRRDLFLRVLEQARSRYRFVIIGYVVMPEHFHLLMTEPEVGNPSVVMKVIKERFTKILHRQPTHPNPADEWGTRTSIGRIWQKRFYDFNVSTSEKQVEKLRYIHRNPVKRGLVRAPEEWKWSSFRSYAFKEEGPVRINCQEWPLKVTFSPENIQSFCSCPIAGPGEKYSIRPSSSITHSSEPRE